MVDMSRYNKLRINPDRYNYDLATNLPLRRTFWRIADKTVLFDNKTYCILAIDIENFHLINKWYGRETGDELLIEIGEALKSIDAGYGTISGYMGGDNFCVIFEENDDVINLIRKRISGIVNGYRGHDITRAYYGAYKTADKDITTGEMCDYAYGALEIAKQRPDKDIFWYDDSMAREQEAEAKLMPEICSAMDNGEFTFYLQPKCILQTGKIIGSEALVRWISPEKGFISPGQFIPLLEKNGFINKLDVYIWDKVCQTIRRWLDEGKERGTYQIRYNMDGTYKWYVFEVTKPTNYSEDNRRVLFTWKEADYQAGAREDAMDIIYNTFIKILRADFLHDRYEPIKSTQEDIIRDAELSGGIKEYIDKYIDMGVVHPEDAGVYRDFVNPDKVLEHFRNNKKSLRLRYRRLLDGEYKWVEMTVSKSKDYSEDIPVFIFYLREVRYIYENTIISETKKKK